jgi:hypothetical protein
MATHPKWFALMTEDLQPRIIVDSTIIGSQFMIGWGAKPASMISWGPRPVFCRLGGRVNKESIKIVDSLVPNEDIMCRAPERRRTLQLNDEGSNQTRKKTNPQWFLDGLTKSQKRRVQRLRQLEQHEEVERQVLVKKKVRSKVWCPKPKADGEEDNKLQAGINVVVFLPKEFMVPADSDVSDEELGMAQ